MRVYKQKTSSFWTADYTTPDGVRVQKSTRCKDREAALRIAREWERGAEHEAADVATGIRRPSDITVADLARDYLTAISSDDHAEGTVRSYAGHLRAYILPYFGAETSAAGLARQHIEAFRRALLAGELSSKRVTTRRISAPSAATVNRVMVTLRRLLDHGVRAGDLRENLARNLRTLKERTRERHRALSDEEIAAWCRELSAARVKRADHVAWLRFALLTGLRDDELQKIGWQHVDLARRWLRVPAEVAKGAKARSVPLVDATIALLVSLPHRTGPLFGTHARGRALANAWARTGLPGRPPTAHDLRHTAASRAAAAGFDLVELMSMFGWESPETAARYLHLYGNRLETLARKLQAGSTWYGI